jgi:hypothetical protein
VVADLADGTSIWTECKGGIINTLYPGQVSRLAAMRVAARALTALAPNAIARQPESVVVAPSGDLAIAYVIRK